MKKKTKRQKQKQKKQKNAVVLKYIRQDTMIVVIHCYLEKENYIKFSNFL